MSTSGGQRLRRYPALAFLVAAGMLAALLPSALRLPLSGPAEVAELAPVPGENAAPGDLSALGGTSTGGLGTGGSGGGTRLEDLLLLQTEQDPGGRGANPSNKRCVGKPARQTEDPLSPPCVPYFAGDNGGATSKGVTRDEIRIVVENCNYSSDSDEYFDYAEYDPDADLRYASLSAHFNERFQLFDRRAHLFEVRWGDCTGAPNVRRAQVQELDNRFDPFAVLSEPSIGATYASTDELARLGVVSLLNSPPRAFTLERAPFVYSVTPDLEDHMTMAVEFVCRRLAGRPARHSGDVLDQGKTRRFGVVYDMPNDPHRLGPRLLVQGVKDRCGAGTVIADYGAPNGDAVAAMHLDEVTTVLRFGLTAADLVAAEASGWHPEWVVLDNLYTAKNGAELPPGQWRNAFGFIFDRRLGLPETQAGYTAAEDGCSGCGKYGHSDTYDALLLFFWGIQSAGPRLTPVNFERGLRALPQRRSTDPYLPAAYLAPGNHSWIKDAAAVWWDPSGTPPGWAHVGCFRLIEDGLRYRAEDWRTNPGDASIKGADGSKPPCQGLS